jgi:broad specificity phosphatase PhoE
MGELQGKTASFHSSVSGTSERVHDFSSRAMKWWNETIERSIQSLVDRREVAPYELGPATENILVVSHGGFIGVLVRNLVSSRKVTCATGVNIGRCWNTSVAVIEMTGRRGVVTKYGDVSHLVERAVEVNVDEL